MTRSSALLLLLIVACDAIAQMTVMVSPPKIAGQKAIVRLAVENHFSTKIESARAVVFLMDEKGKVMAQGTQWIIGGSRDKPALAIGATNVFHFVITADKPFTTTNLVPKVGINRVVLEGGKLANPNEVKIFK